MDDALVPSVSLGTAKESSVLILVVMDDALVLNGIAKGRLTPIEVLILVVMDDALVHTCYSKL
jgi:hypothetical protein